MNREEKPEEFKEVIAAAFKRTKHIWRYEVNVAYEAYDVIASLIAKNLPDGEHEIVIYSNDSDLHQLLVAALRLAALASTANHVEASISPITVKSSNVAAATRALFRRRNLCSRYTVDGGQAALFFDCHFQLIYAAFIRTILPHSHLRLVCPQS